MTLRSEWLPFEPLLPYMPPFRNQQDGYPNVGIATVLPRRLQRAFYRARLDGRISLGMADELAIALGHTPFEIWKDAWLNPDAPCPPPKSDVCVECSVRLSRYNPGNVCGPCEIKQGDDWWEAI